MRIMFLSIVLLVVVGLVVPTFAQNANSLETITLTGADGQTITGNDKLVGQMYGFVQTDAGYNTGRINPDWFDVIRPTQLPGYENEYGEDGETYFSVRQTRFGIKASAPAGSHDVRGIFEWEMFGVGDDVGQTTIRLRHAYLQWGHFGAGQYWSPFMDINVFPNSLEYWGPSGMAFFRNVQVRWMPLMDENNHMTIALERPGASGDNGNWDDVIETRNMKPHFSLPDLSAEYHYGGNWGYVELGGILRYIEWDDLTPDDTVDLSDNGVGWGLNLSTNLKVGPNGSTIRASFLYGEGVENYMNDATSDIGVFADAGDAAQPLKGKLIPVTGLVLFYDLNWNDKWTTAVGYSQISLDNDVYDATASTFDLGRYALLNLQHHPTPSLMLGGELQYGARENYNDGWDYDEFRVQFSFRYRFSFGLEG